MDIRIGDYIMYFTEVTMELKEQQVKEPYVDYFHKIVDIGKNSITIKSYNTKHELRISKSKIKSYIVISREEYNNLNRKKY